MQHFTYKYWSTTQTRGGAILQLKKATKKNTKGWTFFHLLHPRQLPPLPLDFVLCFLNCTAGPPLEFFFLFSRNWTASPLSLATFFSSPSPSRHKPQLSLTHDQTSPHHSPIFTHLQNQTRNQRTHPFSSSRSSLSLTWTPTGTTKDNPRPLPLSTEPFPPSPSTSLPEAADRPPISLQLATHTTHLPLWTQSLSLTETSSRSSPTDRNGDLPHLAGTNSKPNRRCYHQEKGSQRCRPWLQIHRRPLHTAALPNCRPPEAKEKKM
jgi:hypothetical protein